MTTFFSERKKCGYCGKETEIMVLTSTNAFGSSDLDLRPPEMERSAMFHEIEFCEHCGYAAWNLEEKMPASDELTQILSAKITVHDTVKVFERAAKIAQLKGAEKEKVQFLYLVAAWAADDMNDVATAIAMRKQILASVSAEDEITPSGLLRLIDIARRGGEKETARELLKRLDNFRLEPLLKRIAAFQEKLLDDNDTACYTVEDVEKKS